MRDLDEELIQRYLRRSDVLALAVDSLKGTRLSMDAVVLDESLAVDVNRTIFQCDHCEFWEARKHEAYQGVCVECANWEAMGTALRRYVMAP